jgi:hypothetical protein
LAIGKKNDLFVVSIWLNFSELSRIWWKFPPQNSSKISLTRREREVPNENETRILSKCLSWLII